MSKPVDLGSLSVLKGSIPEKIDGFDIPVFRHQLRY